MSLTSAPLRVPALRLDGDLMHIPTRPLRLDNGKGRGHVHLPDLDQDGRPPGCGPAGARLLWEK
ncbi:hypothetical protein HaLaN_31126, partial [Haematococcus lacustris]